MTRLRAAYVAVAFLAVVTGSAAEALSDSPARITNLVVTGLSPLEITFDVENPGSSPLSEVQGDVTLSEASGTPIDRFTIDAFDAAAGQTAHVRSASRWEFELAGAYLIDVALDMGAGALITASVPFRILPIQLPLAPAPSDGSGILTLEQQPANWGLDRIEARAAWPGTHGSADVVVAVIDSGIDSSVPQLADAMWVNKDEVPGNGVDDDCNGYVDDVNGWDFRDNDASSLSGTLIHGHGTGVASIIAARPGRYPIVGVAPGVKLMDVRFLDSSNSFRSSDWKAFTQAVEYAVANGARIINMSIFANGKPPASFEQAVSSARARGVIVVGITGNQGKPEVMYPGRYDSLVTISAVTAAGLLAGFSNYGSEVDLCAPGDSVMTFTAGGRVISQSGTSFAAPHVTGVLALLLSAAPQLSADAAIECLESSAIDLGPRGRDNQFGYGMVDARTALAAALRR